MGSSRANHSKLLKINEMVEAAGVELFSVLIRHKLLILRSATTAKKAPLPYPLYVYCTKIVRTAIESDLVASRVSHSLRFFEKN
jgi:hypothetical protein